MTPILRLALSLIAFGTVGLALSQFAPAESSDDINSRGYVLAISSGPGLSLADSRPARANEERVQAFARSAQRLSCGSVVHFAGVEIGTGCRPASD